jgi:hypothetical protein
VLLLVASAILEQFRNRKSITLDSLKTLFMSLSIGCIVAGLIAKNLLEILIQPTLCDFHLHKYLEGLLDLAVTSIDYSERLLGCG